MMTDRIMPSLHEMTEMLSLYNAHDGMERLSLYQGHPVHKVSDIQSLMFFVFLGFFLFCFVFLGGSFYWNEQAVEQLVEFPACEATPKGVNNTNPAILIPIITWW